MLYNFYRITGAILYPLLVMVSPLLECLLPNWQLTQRFGRYRDLERSAMASDHPQLIWIHASSVGEVQAARALIAVLADTLPDAEIFLTTMTRQGRAVARTLLPVKFVANWPPWIFLRSLPRLSDLCNRIFIFVLKQNFGLLC